MASWNIAFSKYLGPGGFSGSSFTDWLNTLKRNRYAVDVRYWPRLAFITLNSVLNSICRYWENFRYAAKIEQTSVPPPLFILGIWRSGTTHLHNLFAQDERFAYPNTYEVFYPHSFLCTEAWNSFILRWFFPEVRPMDNVKYGVAEPQEDEFALLASGLSPMIGTQAFPRTGAYYRRFLSFRQASLAEVTLWKSTFYWFLRKLTFKYRRPLVLKSPAHTCRIKVLLELFPDAKFVHIHRHPYDVFQSSVNMLRKSKPFLTLQFCDDDIEKIIQDYTEVYAAFFEQRHMIPMENFSELAFEQLEKDPIGELERVYRELGLPDFAFVKQKMDSYVKSLEGYSKNHFPALSDDMRGRLSHEWGRSFEEWDYAK